VRSTTAVTEDNNFQARIQPGPTRQLPHHPRKYELVAILIT